MGRRLRMTAELGDWLTELGGSEPASAAEVGAALLAVLESADPADLALVGQPATQHPPDPREAADHAYQLRLEELQHLRRRVSDVASSRKRGDIRLSAERAAGADAARLGELEHELTAARQSERVLTEQSQKLQQDVDAYRTAKETAKAVYTAAEARLRIAEALEAVGDEPDADLPQLREHLRTAERKLQAVQSGAGITVIRHPATQAGTGQPAAAEPHGSPAPSPAQRPKPPPPPQPSAPSAPGLLELRADPLGSDIRILFALEPENTVTVLAVLEGPEAVNEHAAEAIRLASDLLTEIRAEGWPADVEEVALADTGAFLARFFPADDGSIRRRASVLASGTTLSALRGRLNLSVADVAARSGLDADRIVAIERDGLRTARVHEAIALARALDAGLDLSAGSGQVVG